MVMEIGEKLHMDERNQIFEGILVLLRYAARRIACNAHLDRFGLSFALQKR
jgi:hypothetical protein